VNLDFLIVRLLILRVGLYSNLDQFAGLRSVRLLILMVGLYSNLDQFAGLRSPPL
jgi:hypothetical protein